MGRRKKPILNRLASLLLFMMIALLVFNFSSILQQSMIALGFVDLNWVEIKKIDIEMDKILDSRAVVFSHDNHIIVSFSNKISLYDGDGEFVAKKEINSDSSKIVGMSDYFLVSDTRQGHVTIMDYLGTVVGEVNSIGPIRDIVSVSNNAFVVITEDNILNVYNHEGVLIADVQLADGHLLGIDVSRDQATILVNILSSNDEGYFSNLVAFSMLDNKMMGAHNNEDIVVYGARLYQDDIIIIDDDGQHAYRIGDPKHYLWDSTRTGVLLNFEIDHNGNIFEIVEHQDVEKLIGLSEYHLTCTNKDGKQIFDVTLDNPYQKISLNQGQALLQSDKKIVIYDGAGEIISELENTKKIYNVEWLSSNRILIEYNDYVELLELSY